MLLGCSTSSTGSHITTTVSLYKVQGEYVGLSICNETMPEAVFTSPLASISWLTSVSLTVGSSSPITGAHGPTILPATRALLLGGITAVWLKET